MGIVFIENWMKELFLSQPLDKCYFILMGILLLFNNTKKNCYIFKIQLFFNWSSTTITATKTKVSFYKYAYHVNRIHWHSMNDLDIIYQRKFQLQNKLILISKWIITRLPYVIACRVWSCLFLICVKINVHGRILNVGYTSCVLSKQSR